MNILLSVVASIGVTSVAFAEVVVPQRESGVGSAQTDRSNSIDTVRVKGKGIGTTKEEALRDACRDAIERAVGMYVDSEQLVDNDQLVREKILTHSNAYIEKYDLLKEESANGQVQVRIVAYVKKMALTKRLTEVMPAQTVSVAEASQNLHAQAVTEMSSHGSRLTPCS